MRAGTGDCWLLRQAVLSAPTDTMPGPADGAALRTGAGIGELLGWVASAHLNRRDAAWWRQQQPQGDALAVRTWALAAAAIPAAGVVADLVGPLNGAVASMSRAPVAGLVTAAQRQAGSPDGGGLTCATRCGWG